LGAWARTCRRWSSRLIAPIARGQELRADRSAAAIAGGSAAASALVKVAVVQPLFREVLWSYDPNAAQPAVWPPRRRAQRVSPGRHGIATNLVARQSAIDGLLGVDRRAPVGRPTTAVAARPPSGL